MPPAKPPNDSLARLRSGERAQVSGFSAMFRDALKEAPAPPSAVSGARIEWDVRENHDFLGRSYVLVSQEFLTKVLAPLIAQHRMSAIQSAVLLYLWGRQQEGHIGGVTHKQIAAALSDPGEGGHKVTRPNVTSAIQKLEEWNLVHRPSRGEYVLNPRVCFRGTGNRQLDAVSEARHLTRTRRPVDAPYDQQALFPDLPGALVMPPSHWARKHEEEKKEQAC